MIFSVNPKPEISEFVSLMKHTDTFLNSDALARPEYYGMRSGAPLEDDVKAALEECAKGTPFENTIEKAPNQHFPDIIAGNFYGIEVKSTKKNHWTSTGSSILESSRMPNVERIFLTFGKLGGTPIEFLSRPYEECLYDIVVTHMPRYLINMQLPKEDTIFAKMGITYDELRQMDNPVKPVSIYKRHQLKDGESLWWTGDNADEPVPAIIRLMNTLSPEEKKLYIVYGCVNFPEIFAGNYDRYALWLTSKGIVDTHIRDNFSSGGQESMSLSNGSEKKFPAVYRRVKRNKDRFIQIMSQRDTLSLNDASLVDQSILTNRLKKWSTDVSNYTSVDYDISMDALTMLFSEYIE